MEDEIPFELPPSWAWTTIEYVSYGVGSKENQIQAKQIKPEGKLPVVSQGQDLIDGYCDESNKAIFDLPLVMFGDHTRNVKIIDFNFVIGADGTKFHKIIIANPKYIYYWMQYAAYNLKNRGYARHYTLLKKFLLPLPPIGEQEKIVNKIETILPLIDAYGTAEIKRESLNTAFPEQLKKSILQWAVQGKLVPQDTSDEPAEALLRRIRGEKEALIKAGKIKRDKNESVIFRRDNSHYEKRGVEVVCIDDEIPFEIPSTWSWERLGNIGDTNIGLTYSPADKVLNGGTIVLRSSNIQQGRMSYNDIVRVSCQIPERAMIAKGDILICARNGSRALVGKSAIVDNDGMAFGAFMAKYSSNFNPYIQLFIESPAFRGQLDGVKTETINQITQDMLRNQLCPIPPLAEQKRIVDCVKILMSYCDKI